MAEQLVPRRWRKPLLLGLSGLVFVVIVALAHSVMTPFVMAMVIAYVLTPVVSWVERFRVRRGWAIVLVYVGVLGSLGIFGRLAAPRVGQELGNLGTELRHDATAAREHWIPIAQQRLRELGLEGAPPPEAEPGPALVVRPQPDGSYAIDVARGVVIEPKGQRGWVVTPREPEEGRVDLAHMADEAIAKTAAYVHANAVDLLRFGGNLVASAARAVFVFGITLMLAAYMMLTRESIQAFFRSLVDEGARRSFDELLERLDRGLQGVIRGQLIICLINGVLTAIGFALIGVKYWPVLSLFATVLSLIPIFGVIISSVPAVAVALTQNVGMALIVLAWIVVIHQIEANFLNPKIMGDAAKIHPVLVIFSLIVGEYLFHAKGALLAVPCMSIAQSVFLHFRDAIAPAAEQDGEG
ncbi:MAG TPA: AI-2E family transporter [Polyangiaceae bacterium]|nr:AI-2E family transporter [Polyangiaceae bacterium]